MVRKIVKLENISFKKLCKIEIDRIGKDHSYKLNSSKLIKKLGWKPSINVDQGLLLTKKWIDDSYIRIKKLRLQYQHRK